MKDIIAVFNEILESDLLDSFVTRIGEFTKILGSSAKVGLKIFKDLQEVLEDFGLDLTNLSPFQIVKGLTNKVVGETKSFAEEVVEENSGILDEFGRRTGAIFTQAGEDFKGALGSEFVGKSERAFDRLADSMDNLADKFERIIRVVTDYLGITQESVGAVEGFGEKAAKSVKEYVNEFREVGKVTNESKLNLEEYINRAGDLGKADFTKALDPYLQAEEEIVVLLDKVNTTRDEVRTALSAPPEALDAFDRGSLGQKLEVLNAIYDDLNVKLKENEEAQKRAKAVFSDTKDLDKYLGKVKQRTESLKVQKSVLIENAQAALDAAKNLSPERRERGQRAIDELKEQEARLNAVREAKKLAAAQDRAGIRVLNESATAEGKVKAKIAETNAVRENAAAIARRTGRDERELIKASEKQLKVLAARQVIAKAEDKLRTAATSKRKKAQALQERDLELLEKGLGVYEGLVKGTREYAAAQEEITNKYRDVLDPAGAYLASLIDQNKELERQASLIRAGVDPGSVGKVPKEATEEEIQLIIRLQEENKRLTKEKEKQKDLAEVSRVFSEGLDEEEESVRGLVDAYINLGGVFGASEEAAKLYAKAIASGVGETAALQEAMEFDEQVKEIERLKKVADLVAKGPFQNWVDTLSNVQDVMKAVGEEGSDIYKGLGIAIEGAKLAQTAYNTVLGIQAILTQGSGDPYSAFGRMAAMAALVASLGVQVAGFAGSVSKASAGGGGLSGREQTAVERGRGAGTVFGDVQAVSESIANATDITADATSELVGINRGMLRALTGLQAGITNVVTSVIRDFPSISGPGARQYTAADVRSQAIGFGAGLGAGVLFGPVEGAVLGKAVQNIVSNVENVIVEQFGDYDIVGAFVGDLLSGKSEKRGEGIRIEAGSIDSIIAGETEVGSFGRFRVKPGASDRLFGGKSSETVTENFGIDEVSEEAIRGLFVGLKDVITESADILSVDVTSVFSDPNFFGKALIELEGTAEEQIEQLGGFLSSQFDKLAKRAFPELFDLNLIKPGEGPGEAIARITTQFQVAQELFDDFGTTLETFSFDQVKNIEALMDAAGGMESFISSVQSFNKNFRTEEEQFAILQSDITSLFSNLGEEFPNLNIQLPKTKEGFASLVDGLIAQADSSKDAAEAAGLLLSANDFVAEFFDNVEEKAKGAAKEEERINSSVRDRTIKLLQLQGNEEIALIHIRAKELEGLTDAEKEIQNLIFAREDELKLIKEAEKQLNNQNFIIEQYVDKLGRVPSADEVTYWVDALNNGLSTLDVGKIFDISPEFLAREINSTFMEVFGRVATSSEIAGYTFQIQNNLLFGLDDLQGELEDSLEAKLPDLLSLYRDTLGREPDLSGWNYWVEQIENGMTLAQITEAFLASPEYNLNQALPQFQQLEIQGLRLIGNETAAKELERNITKSGFMKEFGDVFRNAAYELQGISIGDELSNLADQVWELEDAAEETAKGLRISGLQAELLELQGDPKAATQLRRQIELTQAQTDEERDLIKQIHIATDAMQEWETAISDWDNTLDDWIDLLKGAQDDLADAYNREVDSITELKDRMDELGGTFRDFLNDIKVGDKSPLSPIARLSEAEAQFSEVARLSRLGDEGALSRLTDVASTFLDLSREVQGGATPGFVEDFTQVQTIVGEMVDVTGEQSTIYEMQLEELKKEVGLLIDIKDGVLTVKEAVDQLKEVQVQVGADSVEELEEIKITNQKLLSEGQVGQIVGVPVTAGVGI